MKKITTGAFALFALSGSLAFAGTMGPTCTAGNVTVPCHLSGWGFGVEALYLQPTFNSDFFIENYTNSSGYTSWYGFDPDWGWGFELEGSYHFNAGKDIVLNWYHFGKTTDHQILTNTAANPISLDTELKTKWDAVNLEFGQLTNFTESNSFRLHAGVQYGRISNNLDDNVIGSTVTESLHVKYNGFGPRIGMDFRYDWNNGLAIYAKGAAAVLVGDNSFSLVTVGNLAPAGSSSATQTTIVPELEAKLGVHYTYCMAQGDFTVDAGYMWLNYFNAQSFLAANNFGGVTNFGLDGIYFGLKYMGYV